MSTSVPRAYVSHIERHEEWPYVEAAEFFSALLPTNDRWGEDFSKWIFRGHANANWSLHPKAARDASAFADIGILGDTRDVFGRREMVESALEEFRRGLDRSGIAIPVEVPEIRERSRSTTNVEPEVGAFPLMALAQHHGLPTYFLDWTRMAHVAAYFAAAGAVDAATAGGATHLAVWALRITAHSQDLSGWTDLRTYNAPGATNPNLRAQAGLFTILSSKMDSSVEEYVAHMPSNQHQKLELRRLTLSVEEAGKLLRLLGLQGIDGASMFPGADGVVRAMKEKKYWRK